jgi:hypothetical protein
MNIKKVLITQSNYIPWKGYFDAINLADVMVLYDEMQYTKRDWRNRNKIKTAQGLKWLSVPVQVKGKYFQKINETLLADQKWSIKHWNSIEHAYKKAPFFDTYKEQVKALYLDTSSETISDVNKKFLEEISSLLGIDTPIRWSKEFELVGDKTEKLLNICKELNATHYITGPAAKAYMDTSLFDEAGIEIIWMDYSDYPEYDQLHDEFEHGVTILDLLFNLGPDSKKYMKSFNKEHE